MLGVLEKTEPYWLFVKYPPVPDLLPVLPRKMLQFIGAVIFDVSGLLEPVKLYLKHLTRQAMVMNIQWPDDLVPEPLATEFWKTVKLFYLSSGRHQCASACAFTSNSVHLCRRV